MMFALKPRTLMARNAIRRPDRQSHSSLVLCAWKRKENRNERDDDRLFDELATKCANRCLDQTRTVVAASGRPHSPNPLYSWPPLFLVSHAGVPLGLARSALDFAEELSARKELMPGRLMRDDAQVQETIGTAEATVEAARCYVYRTLEELWARLCAGEKLSPRQRAHYRLMMTHAHQAAKQVIGTLYDLTATSAIFRSSPLERNMRDILTSSQHRVVHPKMYRPAGRLILGLDPEELFF